jgi:glycosyltransferase involved in cell wall biosynthesis
MTNEHNDEDNIAILRAKLYEKTRIEEYLRAEVKELWKVINSTHASKVYKTYLLLTKFQNTLKRVFDLKFPSFFNTLKTINNESVKEMSASKTYFFDFVFVIPSNKIEIGGLKSAFNLAKFLFKKGFLVKIIYLNHDPTGSVEDFLINKLIVDKIECSVVVVCGTEASYYLSKKVNLSYKKSVIFMQGPDHYFESDWIRSSSFLRTLQECDLVLAISPYLAKISLFYGAKKVMSTPFGLDLKDFYYQSNKKDKNLLISCRSNFEKGTQLVIPLIPKLKSMGWKVIGFGDLPDVQMARNFDEFFGRLSSTELAKIFRESRILLDPSFIEGLGLTALEAAACGCVPIVGKRESYVGLFQDGQEPFVEIPNFLDPQVVLNAIDKIEKSNLSELVSKNVLRVDWESGLRDVSKVLTALVENDTDAE